MRATARHCPSPFSAKLKVRLAGSLAAVGFCLLVVASAPAQSGPVALEFSVRATPTGGRAEKVMQQPFYLLRASMEEIRTAAREQTPPPDFDAFVDTLHVSPELRDWMKKHHTATLSGDEFLAQLTPDDVMDISEFREAYVTRNLIMVGLGFPKRKAKASDREKNPEKWEQSEKEYWQNVRNYLIMHPESKQSMDEHLLDINAATEWKNRLQDHEAQVDQRFLQLVHSRYLVAKAVTDYEGNARVTGLAPGRYWLTNLGRQVRAGDVRLSWELPIDLRPGQDAYLELNNGNAVPAH